MNQQQQNFTQRYASGDMPWDSGITPPEIFAVLEELPPGCALDLGCGTGTVMRDLLLAGWHADGLDFVPGAIELAAAKLSGFPGACYQLIVHDATRLDALDGLRADYDLIIDIGCGHNFDLPLASRYARGVASRLKTGGTFMLYASHPREQSHVGWAPASVEAMFSPGLEMAWRRDGVDSAIGVGSSWYRWRKP